MVERMIIGKNKLQGPFKLERTMHGKVPLYICGQKYAWFGDIGIEPLRFESGDFVVSSTLSALLKNIPKRERPGDLQCSLMSSEVYSRIISQAKKEGYQNLLLNFSMYSRGQTMNTMTNNLVVSSPFKQGSEHLSEHLLKRLDKDSAKEEYSKEGHPTYWPAVFLTGIKYDAQRKINAKFYTFCYLFTTPNDNAAATFHDDNPEKRRLLGLLHGTDPEKLDELTGLGNYRAQNQFSIQGLGPVYNVQRSVTSTRYGLFKGLLWGEDLNIRNSNPQLARGRLMRTREMRKLKV